VKQPQRSVAVVAQEPSDLACLVAVVYREQALCCVIYFETNATTYFASVLLFLKHTPVLC
jgi:hypothetical protein